MKIENLEKLYEDGKYKEYVDKVLENLSSIEDKHILKLFFRAGNRIPQKLYDKVEVKDSEIFNDIDFLFNRFLYDESISKDEVLRLLKNIFLKNRKDLFEDFILTCLERNGRVFSDEKILEFIWKHRNNELVLEYLKYILDDSNPLISFFSSYILNKDVSKQKEELKKFLATFELSFELFLKNDKDGSGFENFQKGLKFTKNSYIIYNNDIHKIESYDQVLKIFTLKDKIGKVKKVNADEILIKTYPIDEDDFRVYKFFNPEKAKDMDICALIVLILKYKNSGLTKEQLKNELTFIYGREAGSILSRKKKEIEKCSEIEIVFDQPPRFVLSKNGTDNLFKNIERMNDEFKIREYIFNIIKIKSFSKYEIDRILEIVEQKCFVVKNEIRFFLTMDSRYIELEDFKNFEYFQNMDYKEKLLILKLTQDHDITDIVSFFENLSIDNIENIYKKMNEQEKKRMLEDVERSFRLSKNFNILMWYLNFHIDENLLKLKKDYIIFRSLMIANDAFHSKKGDMYITFIKKFFLTSEKGIDLYLKDFNEETAKMILQEISKIEFLNDYQKDIVKVKVYRVFPDLSKNENPDDIFYSTIESINRKREELRDIVNKKLPELSKMIGDAAALGDLSENSEYKFAREQYSLLSSKAEELTREINKTYPIDFQKVNEDVVDIGVTVEMEDDEGIKRYTILGIFDALPDSGIISYLSPLAQKLKGKRVNDTVDGIKILKIEKWRDR